MHLDAIHGPGDLRTLSLDELAVLADELRARILEITAINGGHIGSNLGVVELTLALHRTLDLPRDHLLWDVSHQCYAHKLLTGRGEALARLRQKDGPSGFAHRFESPYDLFTAGHGGPALSQAIGLAYEARRRAASAGPGVARGGGARPGRVVVVVGDASLGEGVALEALNHRAALPGPLPLVVILNDNGRGIGPTIGGLQAFLARAVGVRAGGPRGRWRHLLRELPLAGAWLAGGGAARRPAALFEALGFRYQGPVDGHDLPALLPALARALRGPQPTVLHVLTEKGHGYPGLSDKHDGVHACGGREAAPREYEAQSERPFTDAFRAALEAALTADPRVIALSAAMLDGTGLAALARRFPDRVLDVGMAEQHAVAMASGLAAAGARPVCALYSTFLQRAYDQVIHDVALQRLPVVFALDRAGVVGADGPTHHGVFDLAYLRTVPEFTVAAPADAGELAAMLRLGLRHEGPFALRYPRAGVVATEHEVAHEPLAPGRGELVRAGPDGAVLALGPMLYPALEAARELARAGVEIAVANARFVKPLDGELCTGLVARAPWTLIVEDHQRMGGFGAAVLEACAAAGVDAARVELAAFDDVFTPHGHRAELLADAELDAAGLARRMRRLHEAARQAGAAARLRRL